jgi:hypothetical protein
MLDTASEEETQVEWLRRELQRAVHERLPAIIVGHIPPFIEYWDPKTCGMPRRAVWQMVGFNHGWQVGGGRKRLG